MTRLESALVVGLVLCIIAYLLLLQPTLKEYCNNDCGKGLPWWLPAVL